jgi:hypothetical protein
MSVLRGINKHFTTATLFLRPGFRPGLCHSSNDLDALLYGPRPFSLFVCCAQQDQSSSPCHHHHHRRPNRLIDKTARAAVVPPGSRGSSETAPMTLCPAAFNIRFANALRLPSSSRRVTTPSRTIRFSKTTTSAKNGETGGGVIIIPVQKGNLSLESIMVCGNSA